MTYSGKIDITKASKIKAEEKFPTSEQGYMIGDYQMEQNVKYYWIQEQANHSCPSHIIYGANLYFRYQNMLLKLKEFK